MGRPNSEASRNAASTDRQRLQDAAEAVMAGAGEENNRARTRSLRRPDILLDILGAAADGFTERGYSATTLDDIAHRLGLTKGFIYHYYRSKGDLFIDVNRVGLRLALSGVAEARNLADSPRDQLYAMAREHARIMMCYVAFMRASAQGLEMALIQESRGSKAALQDMAHMRDEYEHLFTDVLREGMGAGVFREVDLSIATKPILGALNGIPTWYKPGRGKASNIDKIADEFATFVVAGVEVHAAG
jgi:AcrR family transcriptional regulator